MGICTPCYYLHNLTPNRAEVKLGLAVAYLNNGQMALALQTFRQFLNSGRGTNGGLKYG